MDNTENHMQAAVIK